MRNEDGLMTVQIKNKSSSSCTASDYSENTGAIIMISNYIYIFCSCSNRDATSALVLVRSEIKVENAITLQMS